jgi:hypothetical protein
MQNGPHQRTDFLFIFHHSKQSDLYSVQNEYRKIRGTLDAGKTKTVV